MTSINFPVQSLTVNQVGRLSDAALENAYEVLQDRYERDEHDALDHSVLAAVEREQDARALWNREDQMDWAESDRYAAASDRIANIQNEY